jgi:hypothetical protein
MLRKFTLLALLVAVALPATAEAAKRTSAAGGKQLPNCEDLAIQAGFGGRATSRSDVLAKIAFKRAAYKSGKCKGRS